MTRDFFLVVVALFTWGLGESGFLSFQSLYLEKLGADPLQIGAILSGFWIIATLAHIPAGILSDRLGRKPLMLVGWLAGLLAGLIMAMATNLNQLVIGLLLYGATMLVMAPMYSYMTAARGRLSVAQAITWTVAVYYFGAVFGPALGGVIGERLGFRAIYWFALATFVFSTVLVVNIKPQPIERSERVGNGSGLLKNMTFTSFMAIFFLVVFAAYLPQPLSPNFLQNERGLDLSQIGLLYSVTSVGIVVFNLGLGRLATRTGFIAGQVAVVLFTIILWKGESLPWYVLAYFLLGGFRATRAIASAQVRTLIQPSMMGLAYGLVETVTGIATILAPVLAGFLYGLNPEWMYILGAGLILLGILASALMLPARSQKLEEISQV